MDSTTTIVGSLKKKKKSKIKKKRLGSCFGPIVAECASRRGGGDHGIVPFSPRGSDISAKDPFHRRSLSGVVKAIFFGTSMAKKFRKVNQRGKIDQTETDSNSNSKPKSQSQKNPENSLILVPLETSSSSSSSIRKSRSSSSLSTSAEGFSISSLSLKSSSSSSSSTQTMSREPEAKSRSCYGSDVGLCLVLISLLVLVFWGKICAILCTSSWLFFVPRLKLRFRSSNCVAMEVYSKEDKKKVVLEGLLERNRLVRADQ